MPRTVRHTHACTLVVALTAALLQAGPAIAATSSSGAPTKAAPTQPAPTQPAPTQAAPTKPAPTAPVATKPVKLSWQIPVTRENGVPLRLADLSGYELYYVSDDQKVSGVIKIAKAEQVNYSLSNLKAGTYHFAIAAIDAKGVKSKLSNMVSAQVKS